MIEVRHWQTVKTEAAPHMRLGSFVCGMLNFVTRTRDRIVNFPAKSLYLIISSHGTPAASFAIS